MRFKKQQKTVSVRQFIMNFDRVLREVRWGRIVRIQSPRGPGGVLLPMGAKARVAYKHQRAKTIRPITKPGRRY